VAEVLGFDHDEALTLGRAVAGLNAYSKGVSPGLFQPAPKEVKEQRRKLRKDETVTINLLHRAVPAKHTDEGLRALSGDSRCGQGVVDVTEVSQSGSVPGLKLINKSPNKLLEVDGEELVAGHARLGWPLVQRRLGQFQPADSVC
jgi:hypothetical protein